MKMACVVGARLIAAALLVIGVSSQSFALDAFWHGVRSNSWNDGVAFPGTSNWYDQAPPLGNPVGVPDRIAKFNNGALKTSIILSADTAINTMLFDANAPTYRFNLNGKNLTIRGGGIQNNSTAKTPIFTVPTKSRLMVAGSAALRSGATARAGAADSAKIINSGFVSFTERAKGGTAVLDNFANAETRFGGTSSAEIMSIRNRRGGTITFLLNSNPGRATFFNDEGGSLSMGFTEGPANDGRITSGGIINDGEFSILDTKLRIYGDFIQRRTGLFSVKPGSGIIVATKSIDLAGTLFLRGDQNLKIGTYPVLRGATRRGHFDNVKFILFPDDLKAQIQYDDNEVRVRVIKK